MNQTMSEQIGSSDAGRYRWRTWLRGELPGFLSWLVPKGPGDCGNHEWYRSEANLWRCYHCEVGLSVGSPFTAAEQLYLERAQLLGEALDRNIVDLERLHEVDRAFGAAFSEQILRREKQLLDERQSTKA